VIANSSSSNEGVLPEYPESISKWPHFSPIRHDFQGCCRHHCLQL
jgi:hypothetical protein